MDSQTQLIKVGKCLKMCPEKEFNFRKQHKLLHVLELSSGQNDCMSYASATIDYCVKKFHRSAAGENVGEIEDLRPSSILLQTLEYLLRNVLNRKEVSFDVRYDFIFDRLRSIRQDAVIQRLKDVDPNAQSLILERCVKFYLYASYRIQNNQQLKIDSHINSSHANQSLAALLELYCTRTSTSTKMDILLSSSSFSAAYILLNLSVPDIMFSVISSCPKCLKKQKLMVIVLQMYFCYHEKNYLRFNKLVSELIMLNAYLPLFAVATFIHEIRADVLTLLCHSHHSKQASFDTGDLCKWLLLETPLDVVSFCVKSGLAVINDQSVKFLKSFLPIQKVITPATGCLICKALEDVHGNKLINFMTQR